MRRRLGGGEGLDSSEMMLDTLTNVFGSVILIACVLAILPRHVMPPPLMAGEDARAQMVERRIEAAQADAERLKEDLARMGPDVDPELAGLESRRGSLRRTLDSLQSEVRQMKDADLDAAGLRASAMSADPLAMAAQLEKLKATLAAEQATAGAAREKADFLKQRLDKLAAEAASPGNERFEMLRFPREKGVLRGPFPVILTGGGIYPLAVGVDLRKNPTVKRLPVAGDAESFRAEFLRGRGIKLPADRALLIQTLKAAVALDLMISIYLYPDSHELFQDLKAAIFEAGGSYGVEFQEEGSVLRFGAGGTQPPEL